MLRPLKLSLTSKEFLWGGVSPPDGPRSDGDAGTRNEYTSHEFTWKDSIPVRIGVQQLENRARPNN